MRVTLYSCLFVFIISYALSSQVAESKLETPSLKPAPWNHLKVNDAEKQFQFAIVSDRTGGLRPGVFAKAIDKLNLLQPEFVLSVGDLIDGYTEDTALMQSQWEEFDALIDGLDVPFFYLPGNHDITNAKMVKLWQERLGPTYYHFIYKDVLFLCLNTENREGDRIDPGQVAYFDSVITAHDDSRWIMVFMHNPLWDYKNKSGYEKIEKLLDGKQYTLFSGHRHQYLYDEKNGKEHFVLATTGGGSALRGARFGELDHITWVTMKESGPVIAHLTLDGIMDKEIVTRDDFSRVQTLRDGSWFYIEPVVSPESAFETLQTHIILKNPTDHPLTVNGKLASVDGLEFAPARIDRQLASQSEERVPLTLKAIEKLVSIPDLKPVRAELTAQFNEELALPATKELIMDWIHECPSGNTSFDLDGNLVDWADIPFVNVRYPQFLQEGWDWHGAEDGWFRFAVTFDNDFLYIAVQSFDDVILMAPEKAGGARDRFYLHVDLGYSGSASGATPSEWRKNYTIPGVAEQDGITCETRLGGNGLIAECAIPVQQFFRNADGRRTFRLNAGYMDHDNPQNTEPSIIWWRPLWDHRADYAGSGVFIVD